MKPDLVVFVGGELAGSLCAETSRRGETSVRFWYDAEYAANADHTPLSVGVPLVFGDHDITNWLDGLLPDEEEVRRRWAAEHGIEGTDPVDLLATPIGYDCAGAVQFCRPGEESALFDRASGIQWLTEQEIEEWIKRTRTDWSQWTPVGHPGRFSLGGAQAKLALHRRGEAWGVPHGTVPTTHILKPGLRGYEEGDLVENVCMNAAAQLGLPAATTSLVRFRSERVLAVERFDRVAEGPSLRRIHQEDMCQALDCPPSRKYQADGGPSPRDIAALIRRESVVPKIDLERFADALIYNWAIMATDGHAKNYSLLLDQSNVVLAPLYDLISYLPYRRPNFPMWKLKFAMKIGGGYKPLDVDRPSAWKRAARQFGLSQDWMADRAEDIMRQMPDAVESAVESLDPLDRKSPLVAALSRELASRSKEVLDYFHSASAPDLPLGQLEEAVNATEPLEPVLCGQSLGPGHSCRRVLTLKPCPFHPGSAGSKQVRGRLKF